jgi:hypothetical protein
MGFTPNARAAFLLALKTLFIIAWNTRNTHSLGVYPQLISRRPLKRD